MPFDPLANSSPKAHLVSPKMNRWIDREWEPNEEDGSTWQVLCDHQRPK